MSVLETSWERATTAEVTVLVGWLRTASNPQRRRSSGVRPGTVNLRTGKAALPEGYAPSTINHTLSALSGFYAFHAHYGRGPAVNPVPDQPGRRALLGYRSPLEPHGLAPRARLRQKVANRPPRSIPDQLWGELFSAMTCDRDRALLAFYISSGARAAEFLTELGVSVEREPKTLPHVPTEDEIRRYYQVVWHGRRSADVVLIKTLLYTGVRVAELVAIRLDEVDLDACRIRITRGKGGKDRTVPFPFPLPRDPRPTHRRPPPRRRGVPVRVQLAAALQHPRRACDALPLRRPGRARPPHATPPATALPVHLAETQGIDDALIQPYSGHASRQSLEIYSRVALTDAQDAYNETINRFPV
ncbi:MAG TPA: site-specific integrase [Aldersonia sp.]